MVSPTEPAFPDGNTPGIDVRTHASLTLLAAFIASGHIYVKGEAEQKAINAADELLKRLNEKEK